MSRYFQKLIPNWLHKSRLVKNILNRIFRKK